MEKCRCGNKAEYTVTLTIEIVSGSPKTFPMPCCEECAKEIKESKTCGYSISSGVSDEEL